MFKMKFRLLVVNQWENIDYIPCPPGSGRCFKNGNDVISSLKMTKVFNITFISISN